MTAEGSPIIKADQMASNGVIHVLSRVMYPIPMGDVVDVVSMNPDFSTLLTAVETAGIAATLKGRSGSDGAQPPGIIQGGPEKKNRTQKAP